MFKEPVNLVVKSCRAGLQEQKQQLSGSLVSAVLDSATSSSPRIYPFNPENSIENFETSNNPDNINSSRNQIIKENNNTPNGSKLNGLRKSYRKEQSPKKHSLSLLNSNRLDIGVVPPLTPSAPPYPFALHYVPAPQIPVEGNLGTYKDSGSTTTSPRSADNQRRPSEVRNTQIRPDSKAGIGRRLFNGFYDDFLDGLPFRRQSTTAYCETPARRYSLMGRAGTARNSEFKRNPIAQSRQR